MPPRQRKFSTPVKGSVDDGQPGVDNAESNTKYVIHPDSPTTKPHHIEKGRMAPLRIPMLRRLQTLSVFAWIAVLPICVAVSGIVFILTVGGMIALPHLGEQMPYASVASVAFNVWLLVAGAYLAFVLLFDRRWQNDGGRINWIMDRTVTKKFGKIFRLYFPASVIFDIDPRVDVDDEGNVLDDDGFVKKYLIKDPHRATLHKTTGPNGKPRVEPREHRSLLFCAHPHGLVSFGVWANMVMSDGAFYDLVRNRRYPVDSQGQSVVDETKAAPVKKETKNDGNTEYIVPKRPRGPRVFDVTTHTMTVNFWQPLWREFLIGNGFCDVARSTLLRRLSPRPADAYAEHAPPIRCVTLVPGGAAESVDCTENILTLKRRKGFVKVAMEAGAALVPCYTFGETKLYRPLVNPGKIQRLQHRIQKFLSVGTPLVCGRGVFNYTIGVLPHRVPLVTVIGKPIEVEQMPKGTYTEEDVDTYHQQYMDAICDLYRRNVKRYGAQDDPQELKLR